MIDAKEIGLGRLPQANIFESLPDFTSVPHKFENNKKSQEHLDANRYHFKGQCAQVYSLLMAGKRITSRDAMIQHGIGHLPRRILDLKEAGVEIKDEFVMDKDGKKTRYKQYFIQK